MRATVWKTMTRPPEQIGLHRAGRACEHMTIRRDSWAQRCKKTVSGGSGTQSIQDKQSCMASMHCNQSMYADGHNCREIQVPRGLTGREPHGRVKMTLHKMSGKHCTQGGRGPHQSGGERGVARGSEGSRMPSSLGRAKSKVEVRASGALGLGQLLRRK